MTIVLDACAAIEIVLDRLPAKHLYQFIETADRVFSTELFKAETTNAFWQYVRKEFLTQDKAVMFHRLAVDLIDEFVDIMKTA